jgi:ATP-dependent helicase/nuclease subunit A
VAAAKEFALERFPGGEPVAVEPMADGEARTGTKGTDGRGEHGVEWGSVIHLLLEAAARGRGPGLQTLASAALAESGLDTELAGEALRTVDSVIDSPLWKRSQEASQRLVETPFHYFSDQGDDLAGKAGVARLLLRGTIDLAFREEDGWVLVDYKTDAATGEALEGLARRYAPQLSLYARIFEESTGERVKERVLYFTETGKQFKV